MMKKFLFISRHEPTDEQHNIAEEAEITLLWVGDRDAFTCHVEEISTFDADGVVVVNPAAALNYANAGMNVGVFENEQRPPVGGKPVFSAKALHVWTFNGGHKKYSLKF